jgi:hypothetical protein
MLARDVVRGNMPGWVNHLRYEGRPQGAGELLGSVAGLYQTTAVRGPAGR